MGNMIIESVGLHLPANAVSTDEILRGCKNPVQFPLELLSGIRSRRMAGDDGSSRIKSLSCWWQERTSGLSSL